jgi:PhnB protein
MTGIQPELWIDRAAAAVAFYEAAFGARVLHQVGEGDEIVAQLAIGDAAFWVSSGGADGPRFSPGAIGGATGRTLLLVDDPDATFAQAVRAGATPASEMADEHGWRLGRIFDPFGHEWEIGKPLGRRLDGGCGLRACEVANGTGGRPCRFISEERPGPGRLRVTTPCNSRDWSAPRHAA